MADPQVQRLPSAEEAIAKMQKRLAVSGEDWKKGMKRPRRDPIAAGIAAAEKHKARTLEALGANRYARGLAKVNRAEMEAVIDATPENAVADGVERRRPKVLRQTQRYYSHLATHVAKIDALPNVTTADAEKRMLENLRGMRAIKDKMRE